MSVEELEMMNNNQEPIGAHPTAQIPILLANYVTGCSLFDRFQHILASVPKVTIVCGAGISTHAGIPDFRSTDGIYTRKFGNNSELCGSELFHTRTLQDPAKRMAYNQALARLRITAREAPATSCHQYIAKLFDSGRLLRCYTQNIDGLQTRDRSDMADVVLEMHGTNTRLRCHICHQLPEQTSATFDAQLLTSGYASCPRCDAGRERMTNHMVLRQRAPGELLPDILLNDDSTVLNQQGKGLDKLIATDGRCNMLLIIGTSLKSRGAANVVKALAKKVHEARGFVIYINNQGLPTSIWAPYIDLHISTNVENWAKHCLEREQNFETDKPKSMIATEITALIADVTTQSNSILPTECFSFGQKVHNNIPVILSVTQPEVMNHQLEVPPPRGSKPQAIMNKGMGAHGRKVRPKVVLVVSYHSWAIFEAQVLAEMTVDACSKRGWEKLDVTNSPLSPHPIGKLSFRGNICVVLIRARNTFRLVIVQLSKYAQCLHSENYHPSDEHEIRTVSRPFGTPSQLKHVVKLLGVSYKLVHQIMQQAESCVAVMICDEQELLVEERIKDLNEAITGLYQFDLVTASFCLRRFRLGDWAAFIAQLINTPLQKEGSPTQIAADCWMMNQGLFENTNLVVFTKSGLPLKLLASPFSERPLGKPLPDIRRTCACLQLASIDGMYTGTGTGKEASSMGSDKRWIVSHDAYDGCNINELKISVTCSNCGCTWRLPCHEQYGHIRCIADRFAVIQAPYVT